MSRNKQRRSFLSSVIFFCFFPFFLLFKKKTFSYQLTDFEKESGFSNYGFPAKFEKVFRWIIANPGLKGNGVSYTPISKLEGVIVPNGLHFERHHYGIKKINPKDYSINFINEEKLAKKVSILELKKWK